MSAEALSQPTSQTLGKLSWSPVYAMALSVAALITAEVLPVSLLTPMAADLGVTEGIAGQAITASAIIAFVSSLLGAAVTNKLDRRIVLLSLTALMTVSSVIVASAPNFTVLMIGRALLGVAVGAFWSMAAATAMRLVPPEAVPKALGIIFGGNAVATVVAIPLGSYLGGMIGWRGVFYAVVPLGLLALVWQFASLPSMASPGTARVSTLFKLLRRPAVAVGMAAVILTFTAFYAFYTYLRPLLETLPGIDVPMISLILLGFGVTSFIGTAFIGPKMVARVYPTLIAIPVVLGMLAIAIATTGQSLWLSAVLIALLGFAGGTIPVVWSTWITRVAPSEAESGGGLLVAAMQLAITFGAFTGGMVTDTYGASGAFVTSGGVFVLAALVLLAGRSTQPDLGPTLTSV